MRYRPNGYDSDDGRIEPGDFWWRFDAEGRRTLVVGLPILNSSRALPCRWTIDHKNHCNAQWSWDGNETSPTLTPSLHAVGHWHGWVRQGELVEA
jgi:hypothetical protein